jgi:prepilin-type N-terminal cleavage/methylation domain-containing protein
MKTKNSSTGRGVGRDDRGFTMVELLITMIVGPIVLGGIVIMLLLVFNVQNGVTNHIMGSVDAQVTTTNLQSDVQNATAVMSTSTGAPVCNTSSTGTQLLATETDGNTVIVSYVRVLGAKSRYSLVRYTCASSNPAAVLSTTVLSNDVSPTAALMTVTCSTTCNPSGSWINASLVSDVSLNVTEPDTLVSYSLTATPRAWTPPTNQAGGTPVPEITLLGTSTNNCTTPALTLGNNSGIQYGNGDQEVTWGSSCTATSYQGTSTWNGNSDSWSNWVNQWGGSNWSGNQTSTTNDPLSSLNAPTYTTPGNSGSCSGGTCSSGTYGSSTTISGPCSFGNGTYVFSQPVTISSGTVTFGSGTYVFNGGLTVQGSSSVDFGTGNIICNGSSKTSSAITVSGTSTVTCGSSGSLVYVGTGTTNFTTTGSVSLCGKSSNQGVAVWDNCSSSSSSSPCVSLCGSSSTSTPCNFGGVYCPNGGVTCTQGKCSSSFVDCGSLCVSGGSTLCVG